MISGVSSVFFGMLGLGGVLCLHLPGLLTLPVARAHYPIAIIRLLIQGTIAAGLVLGAVSAIAGFHRPFRAITECLLNGRDVSVTGLVTGLVGRRASLT